MNNKIIEYAQKNSVPYHNGCEDTYFFGNSVVGASGKSNGELNFLIGPDYTSPNFISSEIICVKLSNEEDFTQCVFDMKRIRNTGVFFGQYNYNGLIISMFDFAAFDLENKTDNYISTQNIVRKLFVKNETSNKTDVCFKIKISENEDYSYIENDYLFLKKDTEQYCFGNRETVNWKERFCRIFCENSSLVAFDNKYDFIKYLSLTNNSIESFSIIHTNYYNENEIDPKINTNELLKNTISYWSEWINCGKMPKTNNIKYDDAVESLLLSVKMQQNRDGGAIAGIRKYANSYVRDTHGCARMFNVCGYFEESKKIILNIHSKWEKASFIPNWWSMGSDTFIGHSFNNDASEVTAYYIFMIRDYIKYSGDSGILNTVKPSMEWAARIQLDWLVNHDYTIDFNGDETEQYCCNNDGEEYGGFVSPDYRWNKNDLSFPSTVAALCSIKYYSELFKLNLNDELQKINEKIDKVFLDEDINCHNWAVDNSEGLYKKHSGQLTNFLLLPLWIGAELNNNYEITDAEQTIKFIRENGFLPNSPQAMQGFCGHTMGMFLYCMTKIDNKIIADKAAETILNSNLLSKYGTVSEFYGPSVVPNGHNCRGFEGGITGEALVYYFNKI